MRRIVFPDGKELAEIDPVDAGKTHLDTSCMSFFSSAYRSLPNWCCMPQKLSPICDRIMFRHLMHNYQCAWTELCRAAIIAVDRVWFDSR